MIAKRVLIAMFHLSALPAFSASPETVTVWQAGADGYHTYRIPAVIVAANGDLLAFCEGRVNNSRDHGNLDLIQKRSTDGGRTWGPQTIVHEEGGEADVTIGNPCPVLDRSTGTLWMPFTRDNDRVFVTHSTDHGSTWSPPRDITADVKRDGWGWYATGPGVGIQLERGPHAGRLVIPCDHRCQEYDCGSHTIFSDDGGQTWQLCDNTVFPGANECQIVELRDGRLMLNARMQAERKTGHRGIAFSDDGGRTWSPLSEESGLADPVVQASLLRLRDGTLLFSNPDSPLSVKSGARVNLTVRKSADEGGAWSKVLQLHEGPSAYSCLVELPDGVVGCLFEAGEQGAYESIRFARFELAP